MVVDLQLYCLPTPLAAWPFNYIPIQFRICIEGINLHHEIELQIVPPLYCSQPYPLDCIWPYLRLNSNLNYNPHTFPPQLTHRHTFMRTVYCTICMQPQTLAGCDSGLTRTHAIPDSNTPAHPIGRPQTQGHSQPGMATRLQALQEGRAARPAPGS